VVGVDGGLLESYLKRWWYGRLTCGLAFGLMLDRDLLEMEDRRLFQIVMWLESDGCVEDLTDEPLTSIVEQKR